MNKPSNNGSLAPPTSVWRLGTQIIKIDVPWSPAQCALIKSLDCADKMTSEEAKAYTKMTGLNPWKPGDKPDKFNLWVLPRGSGKTSISSLVAVRDIVCNSYKQGPGETCLVAIMSPTVRQARDAMRYVSAYCEAPTISPLVESSTVDEIRFRNNRIIRVVPVDKKGGRIRGATFLTLIMDEAAFLEHSGVMVDREIFNAVVAGFRNVSDYRALVISTPNGRTGLCWDFYQDHHGKANSGVFVAHTTIDVIRPNMDATLLEQIRNSDPDSYKIEFLCEFSAGGAKKFFIEQSVEDCIQKGVSKVRPDGASSEYFAAIDVSGGKRDRHAVTIIRRLEDRRIQQVASLVFDPETESYTMREAARQTAELCAEYGVNTVVSDVFGGQYSVEAHNEFGLNVEIRGMNNILKIQRARALDELMQAGQILLLDNEIQTREILQYERRELPSGAISCGHPNSKTASDDLLDALLLAVYESLGNIGELHPPIPLIDGSKWLQGYIDGEFPNVTPDKNGLPNVHLPAAQIAAKGESAEWLMVNWTRSWRFALCSPGELAFLCGISCYEWLNHCGRELILQHQWLRFSCARNIDIRGVSYRTGDLNPQRPAMKIVTMGDFPGIPAFKEIKIRIANNGLSTRGIVSFGVAEVPHDTELVGKWPIDLLGRIFTSPRGDAPLSVTPATPPFAPARREWGVFLNDEDRVRGHEAFDECWRKQNHSRYIESIFEQGEYSRRKTEKLKRDLQLKKLKLRQQEQRPELEPVPKQESPMGPSVYSNGHWKELNLTTKKGW